MFENETSIDPEAEKQVYLSIAEDMDRAFGDMLDRNLIKALAGDQKAIQMFDPEFLEEERQLAEHNLEMNKLAMRLAEADKEERRN